MKQLISIIIALFTIGKSLSQPPLLLEADTLSAKKNVVIGCTPDLMPRFPGGMDSLFRFITKQIIYPARAKENGIQGKCYVEFTVGIDGKVEKIRLMRGIRDCPECDEAVLEAIKKIPAFIPAQSIGYKPVPVTLHFPITFSIK